MALPSALAVFDVAKTPQRVGDGLAPIRDTLNVWMHQFTVARDP